MNGGGSTNTILRVHASPSLNKRADNDSLPGQSPRRVTGQSSPLATNVQVQIAGFVLSHCLLFFLCVISQSICSLAMYLVCVNQINQSKYIPTYLSIYLFSLAII